MGDRPESSLPQWRKESEAHKRAMSFARLLGNGMELADIRALHLAVDQGERWWDAAEKIGQANLARAVEADEHGRALSAIGWYRRAAACLRFGQNPLDDSDPRKADMYRQMLAAYAAAGALLDPPVERLEVEFRGSMLAGWLQRPATTPGGAPPPTVIVFGGFDGWREEYDTGAQALQARGLATLLIDLPGQGEARVLGGVHLPPDPDAPVEAVGAFIATLHNHPLVSERVGVWGNSLGGYVAARVACHDSRVTAVCVNGGSDRPGEIIDRYPRFIRKVELLFGAAGPAAARELLDKMVLTPQLLAGLSCPLLVLHGHPDQVFLFASAQRIYEGALSDAKTLLEWPDGDHCIYNHTYDKHAEIGDWFAEHLLH